MSYKLSPVRMAYIYSLKITNKNIWQFKSQNFNIRVFPSLLFVHYEGRPKPQLKQSVDVSVELKY